MPKVAQIPHFLVLLTQFPDLQYLAQHSRELDGAAAERTLVLVLAAAVLQHNLASRTRMEVRINAWPLWD